MKKRNHGCEHDNDAVIREIVEAELKKSRVALMKSITVELKKLEAKMAQDKAEVSAKLDKVVEVTLKVFDQVVDLTTDMASAFKVLQDKIAEIGNPDLTELGDKVDAQLAKMTTLSDTLKTMDESAEAITGLPTPIPTNEPPTGEPGTGESGGTPPVA